ncbi:zwei Ig domain protein zig-1-like isoform X2 [Physella acuta]|uniref:zwei Ig domain protein zig-1-like isoform X2 n=1 Tax=Physella acuta TaxID=109671 RepID=UPI0027DCB73E|nr:zwei Ig domain protein zig-1-like isoform X2 [Physella acuta]
MQNYFKMFNLNLFVLLTSTSIVSNIIVQSKECPDSAVTPSNSTYYYGNKTATFGCSFNTTVYKFVAVYFEDEDMENGTDLDYFPNGTIALTDTNRADAGLYHLQLNSLSDSCNCSVSYYGDPLVLDFVKSVNYEVDENLDITCDVKGYPIDSVTWKKDGVILDKSVAPRVVLKDVKDHPNARLVIEGVKYSDEGEYSCTAHSLYSNTSSTKSLMVRIKNPIAWVWPLVGILVEIILLAAMIIICTKIDKKRKLQSEQGKDN